ncbi:glycine C-acetyltransferase [Kinneretia asaccharophila]|uniref:2-amino-3-ketobutyrate coenzyme A ligase n=1 Tax=Roseateles asaccharophilus TaxID=582607 RepID=A0A4R6N3D1_9BURK|nr:glycine C-acetyltransferase [Roseateles asaccharophilus]MDN3544561.1 glycine C-acetyltransferase [Roseateles asaccharophilus]TDP09673.1 2-amino-3-ketobutyrate coenzyme A ligase [Roseateles asaccharophilus]
MSASAQDFYAHLQTELAGIREAGLYKSERIISSPQGAVVRTADGREVINLCANNYLGLSSHPQVIEAAHEALRTHGYGLSSVRFICGTQDIHKTLEQRIARFLGTEDTILYAAAFDANGGLFEPLLTEQDAIISDELNHASIIDGIRLCKAKRFRYKHNDLADLEAQLQAAQAAGARFILVFTDGVFSMDGTIAQLDKIREITKRYGALLGIDECHASGFLGQTGRGTHEHRGVFGQIDIITGTLGKALGGASGGFTTGRKEVIELLRQRSRPYLFSNTVAPSIVGASIAVLDILEASTALRDKLEANTAYFREAIQAAGFEIKPGTHPIVPIMVYDAVMAQRLSARILELGVYAVGFFYPVVPKGQARIRVQLSAVHEREHLEKAVAAFAQAGRELGLIK